jgi:hypothetical protein
MSGPQPDMRAPDVSVSGDILVTNSPDVLGLDAHNVTKAVFPMDKTVFMHTR